ncbi:Histidine kinase domain-containing protein [Sulfidibacter corallicola]|uniref:histidine kinase n=1 Tax=Sulfidibacter corallicola TaxID=2818388 RepID=A0A8A4TGZ4_SULCO|nr:sensor histidine kinase [Sulfidibacter corallicola]QTD49339.1 hypothetical protein J3U87_27455 [Sulfidibacter corallicola]
MRHFRSLFALTLLLPFLHALDPDREPNQYRVTLWGAAQGLPQLTVNDVLQAKSGYLWVATQNGLARFDGHTFENFYQYDDRLFNPVFKDGYMEVLLEDPDGTLWIGTRASGLVRLRDGVFEAYTLEHGLPSLHLWSLARDTRDRLWIGTSDGLCVMEGDRFRTYTTADGLGSDNIVSLLADDAGRVWIGTDQGLSILEGETLRHFEAHEEVWGQNISALFQSREGTILVSTRVSGLMRAIPLPSGDRAVDETPYRFEWVPSQPRSLQIEAICEDSGGNIWLGTGQVGLARYREGRVQRYTGPNSQFGTGIYSIAEDAEQTLWVGTRNGFFQYQDGKYYVVGELDGLPKNLVWSVMEDNQGAVWMGTEGGGISRWHEGKVKSWNREHGLVNEFVLTVLAHSNGDVWAGTRYGLGRLRDDRVRVFTKRDGMVGDYIRALMEDREGNLWVGTKTGVAVWDGQRFTNYTAADGLTDEVIRAFYQDREGTIWIATDHGLSSYADGKFRSYTTDNGLANNSVRAILEDDTGALWFGTYGGLNRLVDGQFSTVTRDHGLFQDILFKILDDGRGHFWMTTHDGFFRVSQADLHAVADGRLDRLTSTVFGSRGDKGLVECNGGSSPCGWRTADGRLLMPSMTGLIVLDPSQGTRNPWKPPTYVTKVLVDGVEVPPDARRRLPPETEKIAFHFTGISFEEPAKVRFRVQLEGFDKDWEDIGNLRFHYYTALPPGNYRFRVQAANNDGVWNEVGDSVSFYLEPYFYETKVFYAFALVMFVLLIFGGHQLRLGKVESRKNQLEELVRARTQALEKTNRELQAAQGHLVRAAHLAGMAEISADVIHNLGNGLNGVNVSAGLIRDFAHKLPTEQMTRLGELLVENQDHLGEFLSEDPRGVNVVPFVERTAQSLERLRIDLAAEGQRLTENVKELNEVIRAQQALTEQNDRYEVVEVRELVNEAVLLQADSIRENRVNLVTEISDSPLVRVQKTKLLRALGNLVKNAWESTVQVGEREKQVRIHTFRKDGDWVRLEITDNGAGIAPEDITRVFHQGYTTKKHGHGFSLHYCGNVISEMKGKISVHSDGPGTGATFQIDLPIAVP